MKNTSRWLSAMLLSVFFLVLSSCEHKELCDEHPHTTTLRLEFDWRHAPEADPEGMSVFFYPADGQDAPMRRIDFNGRQGGSINIQVGRYRVLSFNNDTESNLFRGADDFYSHETFTRECSIFEYLFGAGAAMAPRAKGAEDERVVLNPDMMWGSSSMEIEVTPDSIYYSFSGDTRYDDAPPAGAAITGERVITLYPAELICTYTYEILDVKNLKYATQMSGTLSSMSPSLAFNNQELGRECITTPFPAYVADSTTIKGKFLTFGHHEENERPHKLVMYVWFSDGSKYYYTFDVTDQIHSAPDKRHVHLILRGLDFPQPIGDGSGLDPSVDDWLEIEGDIIM